MSIQYHLSNQQVKAIMTSGKPLLIALPLSFAQPPQGQPLKEWAKTVFNEAIHGAIRGAKWDWVRVIRPYPGKSATNLTEHLGSILPADAVVRDGEEEEEVAVIVVEFGPKIPRYKLNPRPQWPKTAIVNRMRVPPAA